MSEHACKPNIKTGNDVCDAWRRGYWECECGKRWSVTRWSAADFVAPPLFTRDDVELLRLYSQNGWLQWMTSLADRIESLLPPEFPSVVPVESSSFGEPK